MTPPLQINKHYTVNITDLAGLGDGVGYVDGQKIFVPYTLPGDTIKARITKTGKEYSQAELITLLSPAPTRQTPPCKHFYTCGGCSLQHMAQENYIAFKHDILVQAVARAGLDTNAIAPLIYIGPTSRRRAVFKVEKGRIGYYQAKSHILVAIEECPILETPLETLIPHLNRLVKNISRPHAIDEITLSLSDTGIEVIINSKDMATLADLETLAEFAKVQDLAGVSWQSGREVTPVAECRTSEMVVGAVRIAIPSGSFQQATKAGQAAITREIIAATEKAGSVLDLYAGCGGYSFAMADYTKVHAVEGDEVMTATITQTAKKYGLTAKLGAETRDLVKRPFLPNELKKYDAVVINPPRNGAKAQVEQLAKSNVGIIAMVSCNPVTFSTDARILASGGYHLKRAVPIDQFIWNQHLELVAIFGK